MKFLIATIRLALIFISTLILVCGGLLLWSISGKSATVSRFITQNWAKSCLLILNIKVDFSGRIPERRAILMANHRSYIDIFLVLSYYPASIVAKQELGKWPVIGFATHLSRMILVDRSKNSSLIRTMRAIKAEIDRGGSVILFPEGGIKPGDLTNPFKHGSFKIAQMTDTPVIPAAISYPDKGCYWGNETFIKNFYRQMGKWRTESKLWIGAPIKAESMESLMQATKETIDSKLLEYIKEK